MDGEVYGTCFPAGAAGNTRFLRPLDLYQAEAVEEAVDGAQRAEILAERAVDFYGEQQDQNQDAKLPEEESAGLASQQSVGGKQGQRTQERAGGAQIFAECRDFGKAAEQEHGTDAYEQDEDGVFSIY